ncbi:MAG TPA: hypothetical protein VGR79_12625 [Stellaceae bacterium]|nr:hypothetical protein [Stellaceae bacterium]
MTTRAEKTLADVGKWPAPKIEARSHKIIRHAYEQVVTACARLGSFATGKPPQTNGPIDERQEALAADDLVSFAIHARRLIDASQCRGMLRSVEIRSFTKSARTVRVRDVINKIIHHEDIQIVRTVLRAGLLAGRYKLEDILDVSDQSFSPLIAIKSERGEMMNFELRELIETFQKKILVPIIDFCAEHDLYLEDLTFLGG